MNKLDFLKTEFQKLLISLKPYAKGNWGVMNGQQMVEHMTDAFRWATDKQTLKLHTLPEHVGKYKEFAMSDKEFKPNTKNALMAETASPVRNTSMQNAIAELEKEIAYFIDYYEKNKGVAITNPFFGDLNFEEQIHLLHKHAVHHCKQFGLI
jgi:hypothetical protein